MNRNWTQAQLDAINLRDRNLLVSAAAGAGKTAVLVERVLRRLTDPIHPGDVDRLLIVTFTETAAAEMRQRLADRLGQAIAAEPSNQGLRRQLSLLGRASISTLHAFCLQTVRQYFYRLDLDPALEVLGDHEAALLEQEVLDTLFEDRYAAADAAKHTQGTAGDTNSPANWATDCFLPLIDAYSDETLRRLILELHHAAYSQPWPETWLDGLAVPFALAPDAAIEATPWCAPLKGAAHRSLERAVADLDQALLLCRLPGGPRDFQGVLAVDRARLSSLAGELPGLAWDATLEALTGADTWAVLKGGKDADLALKDEVKRLRDRAKDAVRSSQGGTFRPAADLLDELRSFAPLAQGLVALVRAFDTAFTAAKRARGALDFADMERYGLRLLSAEDAPAGMLTPSAVARELKSRFDEILVDEYQDINALQDAILTLVAGPHNRFVVGDVKQSIYRFRHAEPQLFVERYRVFPPARGSTGPDGRIELSHNFRSRRTIVDAVNFVCRQIMTSTLGGLPYDAAAELVYGANYSAGGTDAPVELHLLERALPDAWAPGPLAPDAAGETGAGARARGDAEAAEENWDATGDLTALEREAALVARRIRELVEAQTPVWDRGEGCYRPMRHRDVVVLLRAARTQLPCFVDVLTRAGVPVYGHASAGYFEAVEVQVVLALLRLIDNPIQDIPLATVLRSSIVGLSAEDLARVRLGARGATYYAAARVTAESATPLGGRVKAFLERLDRWRTCARRGPLSRLIDQIYAETGFLAYALAMPGGAERRANLLALADRARQFDHFARQGLFRFLRFIEQLQERGQDLAHATALSEQDDVVRVTTIHQSKGLEFPVVVVANLGGEFARTAGDVLLDREIGLGPKLVDPELRVKYPSLAHHAVREAARRQDLAEEVRTLYVALTRARERLILVGSAQDLPRRARGWVLARDASTQPPPEETARIKVDAAAASEATTAAGRNGWALPDTLLCDAKCYLDWLGPALARHREAGEPLRRLAWGGFAVIAETTPLDDPSRWEVRVWNAAAPAQLEPPLPSATGNAPVDDVETAGVGLQPLPGGRSPSASARIDAAPGGNTAATCNATRSTAQALPVTASVAATLGQGRGRGAPAPLALSADDWRLIAALEPLPDRPVNPALAAELAARVLWTYPRGDLANRFAKRSVTDLRARLGPLTDEAPSPAELRQGLPARPRFLNPEGRRLDGAARGTAVHAVLECLDLNRPLDAADVARQIAELVAHERITAEQAAAVEPEPLARFFTSPLGRRLRADPARVRREWMFSLGLPAARVYPDLAPELAAGETVLVQGVIDCLVAEDDGFWILDFKTDRLRGRPLHEVAAPYRVQLALYAEAVTAILGRPVREMYLYFLEPGREVAVGPAGPR